MLDRSTDTSKVEATSMGRHGIGVARALMVMVLADLSLLFAGYLIGTHSYALLSAHIVLVLALARRLGPANPARRPDSHPNDRVSWLLGVVLLLVAGPLGGVGALALAGMTRRTPVDRTKLAQWHASLAGHTQIEDTQILHEALLAGREFRPKSISARRFSDVLAQGTLAEKQALLGHIGLKYHTDYFSLLEMALRSQEAGVRAQAAAVFVKLKEGFRHQLRDASATAVLARSNGDGRTMLAAATTMIECAGSGFLDVAEARKARLEAGAICPAAVELGAHAAEADVLMCRIFATTGGGDAMRARLIEKLPALTATLREELARCLIVAGQHADLNRLLSSSKPSYCVVPSSDALSALPPTEAGR